jgi:hydrogenase 3 maturation protease
MIKELKHALERINPAESIIVGMGNVLKKDDGVGSILAERLLRNAKIPVLDTCNAPENYIGKIISFHKSVIIFLDALDFGAVPGTYKLFSINDVYDGNIASHTFSIGFIFDLIRSEMDCEAYVLGIQPAEIRFGSGLTDNIANVLDEISDLFEDWISRI